MAHRPARVFAPTATHRRWAIRTAAVATLSAAACAHGVETDFVPTDERDASSGESGRVGSGGASGGSQDGGSSGKGGSSANAGSGGGGNGGTGGVAGGSQVDASGDAGPVDAA